MHLNEWRDEIHSSAIENGWWTTDRNFGELCALFHSEITEAFEEWRNGRAIDEVYYSDSFHVTNGNKVHKPEGVPVELADIIIRVLDMFGRYNLDAETLIEEKLRYNTTRGFRHGGKRA